MDLRQWGHSMDETGREVGVMVAKLDRGGCTVPSMQHPLLLTVPLLLLLETEVAGGPRSGSDALFRQLVQKPRLTTGHILEGRLGSGLYPADDEAHAIAVRPRPDRTATVDADGSTRHGVIVRPLA